MTVEKVENLAERLCSLNELPALPGVAMEILEKIRNPDTSMHQLAEILATDPPLSAKVLNVVNSPFFGLPHKITNLPHAVNLLGEESLKYIALSFSLVQLFAKGQNKLDYSGFWKQSLVCAVVSRLVAKQIIPDNAEDLYLIGLLHNIGILVMAQSCPRQYAMVIKKVKNEGLLTHQAENEIFGCNHMEVGAFLLTSWGFPESFTIPVACHHNPEEIESSAPGQLAKTRIIHLSTEIFSFLYENNNALGLARINDLLDQYQIMPFIKLETLMEQACAHVSPLLPFFDLEKDEAMDYLKILEESKKELFRLSFDLTNKIRKQNEKISKLSRLAYKDGLTGLPNFQSFQEALDREMSAIERYGHSSVLAMMDLDHFKAINDVHGHAAGDLVLKEIGQFFSSSIRQSDIIARYGGEEFVLILSRTEMDAATRIIKRLQEDLEELKVKYKDKKISVTMSAGITLIKPDCPFVKSELLWQADQALYLAKNSGRNCCVVWQNR